MAVTTDLNITLWTALQNNPDATVNDAIKILEAGAIGKLTHDMGSDADYTLATTGTVPYEWQNHVIEITDTGVVLTGAVNIIVPDYTRLYVFSNVTAQALTLKTAAGSGIAVATTKWAMLYCDGTNVVRLTPDA